MLRSSSGSNDTFSGSLPASTSSTIWRSMLRSITTPRSELTRFSSLCCVTSPCEPCVSKSPGIALQLFGAQLEAHAPVLQDAAEQPHQALEPGRGRRTHHREEPVVGVIDGNEPDDAVLALVGNDVHEVRQHDEIGELHFDHPIDAAERAVGAGALEPVVILHPRSVLLYLIFPAARVRVEVVLGKARSCRYRRTAGRCARSAATSRGLGRPRSRSPATSSSRRPHRRLRRPESAARSRSDRPLRAARRSRSAATRACARVGPCRRTRGRTAPLPDTTADGSHHADDHARARTPARGSGLAGRTSCRGSNSGCRRLRCGRSTGSCLGARTVRTRRPRRPWPSRNTIRSSPSSRVRCGRSLVNVLEIAIGCQYRRMASPIGVPGLGSVSLTSCEDAGRP